MEPVRVAKMGTHTLVSGPDKAAVETRVYELLRRGARLIGKVEPVGRTWVATLEEAGSGPDQDGCRVARLGLQIIVTGPDRASVHKRVQALMQDGAVLKWPPQENTNGWSAVLDEAGVDKTGPRT
jgi:hypothetical protein